MGNNLFSNCLELVNVTIENSVTSIGSHAFSYCSSLNSINIPSSVALIGSCPFIGCTNLLSINVDDDNSEYDSLDGVLFNKDRSMLIQMPGNKTGSYNIPKTVTNICDWAFAECINLVSVNYSNLVKSIGKGSFYKCIHLSGLIIPNSVVNVGESAFSYCNSLISITNGNSVIHIDDLAFSYCDRLVAVYFRGNAPDIGNGIFSGTSATIYYLLGTSGWSSYFADRPTAIWGQETPTPSPTSTVMPTPTAQPTATPTPNPYSIQIQSFDTSGTIVFTEITNASYYSIEWTSSLASNTWYGFEERNNSLCNIPAKNWGVITVQVPVIYRVTAHLTNSP